MDTAIANLQARLAKGGGTPGDWELLAKSYDFLGRPADAAKARAHQLPAPGAAPDAASGAAAATKPGAAPTAVAVSGEVTLDPALSGKVAAGDILFILAKSVDSPGAPVAAIRSAVGKWPLAFTLDDSQSMMPGRTLSSAGRVTIEARISKKGQPLAAPGDLQGSSGPIDPAAHKPLQIKIDRVIG
jgi:cytochrome c-type biogenesis protein CcmH